MPTPIRIRRSPPRHRVAGTFLLEALLALVVFSVGTLGILELIAGAQRESGNARWRSEAAALAASALARMWAEHPATLESRYGTSDGAGYRALRAAAQRLPGVAGGANLPQVDLGGSTAERWRVAVTVFWQQPGDSRRHRAVAAGTLPRH